MNTSDFSRRLRMTCFVTVGTTRFDELINEVLKDVSLLALRSMNVTHVMMQIGAGQFTQEIIDKVFKGKQADEGEAEINGLKVEYYRYKPSIADDMKAAKIIIGHAGAGTCLECLRLRKLLVVVVNERLMDNHQAELATEMASKNHLIFCTPSSLAETIGQAATFTPVPFDPPSQKKVAGLVDRSMGIAA